MSISPEKSLVRRNAVPIPTLQFKTDWPFAKIGINLEAVGSRFEGILRLIYLEYHLRDPGIARKTMQDAKLPGVHSVHPPSVLARYTYNFYGTESIDHIVP